MKRIVISAILLSAALLAGCSGLVAARQMSPATSSQVAILLQEADKEMVQAVASQDVAASYPANSEVNALFAKAAQTHIQAALDKAHEAYNLEPRWPLSNKAVALCESKMGNSDKAIQFAERAMKLDPSLDDLLTIIASEYVRKGLNAPDARSRAKNYNKAISYYQAFIEKYPNHLSVEYLQTTIAYLQDEINKSE